MPHEPKVGELPALPVASYVFTDKTTREQSVSYDDDAMRAYATAAILAEREARKNEARWISVEERLPPRSRVLAYFPTQSTSPMDALYDGEDFIVDGRVRTKAVTYWMLLPAPPAALQAEQPEGDRG